MLLICDTSFFFLSCYFGLSNKKLFLLVGEEGEKTVVVMRGKNRYVLEELIRKAFTAIDLGLTKRISK